jgi:hypothetical protein
MTVMRIHAHTLVSSVTVFTSPVARAFNDWPSPSSDFPNCPLASAAEPVYELSRITITVLVIRAAPCYIPFAQTAQRAPPPTALALSRSATTPLLVIYCRCLATIITWLILSRSLPSNGVIRQNNKKTPWPLVRKRTIPTERPPLVDKI